MNHNRIRLIAAVCFAASGSLALVNCAQMDAKNDTVAPVAGVVPLRTTVTQSALVATGWRASKLLKTTVYNDHNEKVGSVDDLIVSPKGELTVAVVDVGGFLGINKHLVAVPVDRFAQFAPPKAVLPGASKEQLKELPEFTYTQ